MLSRITDDYRAHTSCLTEVERYEKRTPKKNGKVPPQQLWMDLITDAIATAPQHLQQYLKAMSTLDNVPRKEKTFRNFTANSLNLRGKSGEATVSDIWNYLKGIRAKEVENKKPKEQPQPTVSVESKATITTPSEQRIDEVSNGNDTSLSPDMIVGVGNIMNTNSKCDSVPPPTAILNKKVVKKAMKKVLKRASDRSMTLKMLRKTIRKHLEASKSDVSLIKDLVQKNLESNTFVVDGKKVILKVE